MIHVQICLLSTIKKSFKGCVEAVNRHNADNTKTKKKKKEEAKIQCSTKHCTENQTLSNRNFNEKPTVNLDPPEELAVPAPLVTSVVLLVLTIR